MLRLSAALLVVLAACGTPTPTPDGGGAGSCGDSRSPPSLLTNWNFECGATGWQGVYGTFEAAPGEGKGGSGAGKLTVGAAGGRMAYAADVVSNAGSKTFCVTAQVKGSVPYIRLRVLRDFGGGVQEVAFAEALGADFKRTPPVNPLKVTNDNANRIQLVFEAQTTRGDGFDAQPGQTLVVDDVDFWETSGACAEAR